MRTDAITLMNYGHHKININKPNIKKSYTSFIKSTAA